MNLSSIFINVLFWCIDDRGAADWLSERQNMVKKIFENQGKQSSAQAVKKSAPQVPVEPAVEKPAPQVLIEPEGSKDLFALLIDVRDRVINIDEDAKIMKADIKNLKEIVHGII